MNKKKYWSTPIGQTELFVPDKVRNKLIESVKSNFDINIKELEEFEKISNELIKYYLSNAFDVGDIERLTVESRLFGIYQKDSKETDANFQKGFDGVLNYYLKVNDKCEHLFFDPRPSIDYPVDEKISVYKPKTGTVLIYPSYLLNNIKSFVGSLITINYRIVK